MHPDLLRCLTVLAVVRLLSLAAVPAPVPAHPIRAGRTGRARAPAPDQLAERVTDTRPPRPRPAAVELPVPTRPAPPPGATADPDRPPAAASGAHRPARRGIRSRRRGPRGGRIWRVGERTGQLYVAQLNIQSMKPKLLELRHDIAQHDYDVVVLCETWLKSTTHNRLIPVPGWRVPAAAAR